MSLYVASFLPQPQLGVPYNGYIVGGVQGGATGSITFDVYTGGVGPQGSGANVAASQYLTLRGRASTRANGSNPNAPEWYYAHPRLLLRSYAETGAPMPSYNAGYASIPVSTAAVVEQDVPSTIQETVTFSDEVIASSMTTVIRADAFGVASSAGPLFGEQLSDAFSLSLQMALDARIVASDGLNIGHNVAATWIHVLRDAVALAEQSTASYDSHTTIVDHVALSANIATLVRMARSDGFNVTDAPSAWMGVALALRDSLRFSAPASASYDLRAAIIATFALRDLLRDAQRGILADNIDLTEALVARVNAFQRRLDALELQATVSRSAILHAILTDTAQFADAATEYLAIRQALVDGAQFGLTVYTGQDTYTAWVMTPATRAMRRYLNYPFNSFAMMDGRVYGAGVEGVFLLEGTDDAGAPIAAAVRTGLMDFGLRQLKRMDRAYLGYASDGTLCLRVINTSETGAKMECTYKMVQTPADAPREQRIQIGRGLQSVYWQFELVNEEGSAFELHDMTLLPMVLSRRVR